ncbi:MAG: AEC family transporter [Alphaproteobacteria bacterium]
MDIVINVIGPVFGIVIMGYAATKVGWFSESAADGLARFVFDFAIPIFLFRTLATSPLPDSFPLDLFATYYIGCYGGYAAGVLVGRFVFGRNWMGAVLTGLACSFGNTILLGVPLVLRAFGDEGAVPMFLILSVHGLTLFTATTLFMELANKGDTSFAALPLKVLRNMAANPIILGLAGGLIANLTGFTLPGIIDDVGRLMQAAASPCALFALGATVARFGFAGRLTQTGVVMAIKMVAMPLAVWLLATRVFDLDPLWAMVATLMAAQPSGANVYLFASRYGTATAIASSTVFLSTAVSIVTISALLYSFGLTG